MTQCTLNMLYPLCMQYRRMAYNFSSFFSSILQPVLGLPYTIALLSDMFYMCNIIYLLCFNMNKYSTLLHVHILGDIFIVMAVMTTRSVRL